MEFKIQKSIIDNFGGLTIGLVLAKNINNNGNNLEINELLRKAEKRARENFSELESPSQHPYILPWRQAYKKFGVDPHKYRCSSEALARRTLKGEDLNNINKAVDLYNYISLKYILPVGGEDLDKIEGDLLLDFAEGTESFIRLGGTEEEPPQRGEVVYKDNRGVICRCWNWREAERTKLTPETKSCLVAIEGLPPVSRQIIGGATEELAELITKYCGGKVDFKILDIDELSAVI